MTDLSPITPSGSFTEAAIFSRVVEGAGDLSPKLAEHIILLGISEDDQRRVKTLLEKNTDGSITEAEREELENLNHIADLLSLWHSRARQVLKLS